MRLIVLRPTESEAGLMPTVTMVKLAPPTACGGMVVGVAIGSPILYLYL